MTTKDRLLALLETQRGSYFSGEELARQLSVSRAAVWKAVQALRAAGYAIDAVPNRGYCLAPGTDILSQGGIQRFVSPRVPVTVQVLESVSSTNALLRDQAAVGAPEGTAVAAARQTQGRGRLGRSFYSPPDTGVYLSLLLRPCRWAPDQAVRLTTMAALAVCEAVEEVSGLQPGIKWVNDLYLNGRKICGILTEGALSLESGHLDYVVVGIGLNVYTPPEGFPPPLSEVAGALFTAPQPDAKNRLAAAFLNHFWAHYSDPGPAAWAACYRARSLVLGRRITVEGPDGLRPADALDVDEACRLVVRYADDGSTDSLQSGEIRIQL